MQQNKSLRPIFEQLSLHLEKQQKANLFRTHKILETAQRPQIYVGNKCLLNFCSNDYLGLAADPRIIENFTQAAKRYGVGSGASHLVTGHSRAHHMLEEEIAAFTGRSRALLFSSGYMANLAVVSALLSRHDAIYQDRLNHASLLDAARLANAKQYRYEHKNVENLLLQLKRTQSANQKIIATDSVFSMDGDIAPLDALAKTAKNHQALLMVDDAHGFGVVGKTGAGSASLFNLDERQLPILMCTLGKSVGVSGAAVLGSSVIIESLVQFARPYIYTTAMPPALAEAARASLKIIADEPERRLHLTKLILLFKKSCSELNIPLIASDTPIQPVLIGNSERAMKISQLMQEEKNIYVAAIRPPTVPKDTARLRVTLTAAHTETEVSKLVDALHFSLNYTNKDHN